MREEAKKRWTPNHEQNGLADVGHFSSHTGCDRELAENKALRDGMPKRFPVRPPVRQGMHEGIAAGHVAGISGAERSDNCGPDGMPPAEGDVLSRDGLGGMNPRRRGIDFGWRHGPRQFHAGRRHTRQPGGVQCNRYEDPRRFLEEAGRVPARGCLQIWMTCRTATRWMPRQECPERRTFRTGQPSPLRGLPAWTAPGPLSGQGSLDPPGEPIHGPRQLCAMIQVTAT